MESAKSKRIKSSKQGPKQHIPERGLMEDEEDIYAPNEGVGAAHLNSVQLKEESAEDAPTAGNEEEESEEEDTDSDIDIITERQPLGKTEPVPQAQHVSVTKGILARTDSPGEAAKGQPLSTFKAESNRTATPTLKPGSTYPPFKTSNVDVDAKPIYEPNGKPITEIDMDADFPEDDKSWRKPGTDTTDFFNYGFDEFTWASYCLKQESLRKEVVDQKKQMEEMQSLLGMPGAMPGPGMPMLPAATAVAPMVGGSADMPPELQQMMQSMMAQGVDPSQLDFNTFASMMTGNQANMGGQGYGQQSQQGQNAQQMGYGYGSNNSGGGNRNQGGRGQGRRW